MDILKRSSKVWVSELTSNLSTMWDSIEADLAKNNSSTYLVPLQKFIFNFLIKSLIGCDPSISPEIAESGFVMIDRWLALQLLPTVKIGVLQPLEEVFLHSFSYPFFLVSGDYNKLYQFILDNGKLISTTTTHNLFTLCIIIVSKTYSNKQTNKPSPLPFK